MILQHESPPCLHLAADGLTAPRIVTAIADLVSREARHGEVDRLEVVVDVTNAWSIPWTAQPLEVSAGPRGRMEAYLRHVTFRHHGGRTEAVYEVAA